VTERNTNAPAGPDTKSSVEDTCQDACGAEYLLVGDARARSPGIADNIAPRPRGLRPAINVPERLRSMAEYPARILANATLHQLERGSTSCESLTDLSHSLVPQSVHTGAIRGAKQTDRTAVHTHSYLIAAKHRAACRYSRNNLMTHGDNC